MGTFISLRAHFRFWRAHFRFLQPPFFPPKDVLLIFMALLIFKFSVLFSRHNKASVFVTQAIFFSTKGTKDAIHLFGGATFWMRAVKMLFCGQRGGRVQHYPETVGGGTLGESIFSIYLNEQNRYGILGLEKLQALFLFTIVTIDS